MSTLGHPSPLYKYWSGSVSGFRRSAPLLSHTRGPESATPSDVAVIGRDAVDLSPRKACTALLRLI